MCRTRAGNSREVGTYPEPAVGKMRKDAHKPSHVQRNWIARQNPKSYRIVLQ